MKEYTSEQQTRIYLYDLMNTAREHGFKREDCWEIALVADDQQAMIQRRYYPALIARMLPETILEVFHAVKSRLNQPLNVKEEQMDIHSILKEDLRFLVAYNTKRPRT